MRALAFAAALTIAPPVAAQVPCFPFDEIVALLMRDFAEEPVASGVTLGGDALTVFASPKGTWTLVITRPGMPSCMVLAGTDYQPQPVEDRKL